MNQAAGIVAFWRDAGRDKWFERDEAFDAEFDRRFHAAHLAAARREQEHWIESAEGSLALLILLDQFPRNCFRECAHSYATDGLARHYAHQAIADGFDLQVDHALRMFFYLPFEHSEAMADQEYAMELFAKIGDDELMKYAVLHRDLIARFGRFPHRNEALGRESTREEVEFLASGGFSG
ncbi:MAG: DUF924 family protein [Pseudoxanthomonas sp.]